MSREQPGRSITKLGAIAMVTAVFLASLTGGYYTYALFADVETVGLSFEVAGNFHHAAGNTPVENAGQSAGNDDVTGINQSSTSGSNTSRVPPNRTATPSSTPTPSSTDNASNGSSLHPPNPNPPSARATPKRIIDHYQ